MEDNKETEPLVPKITTPTSLKLGSEKVETSSIELPSTNGIATNGIAMNGIATNGIANTKNIAHGIIDLIHQTGPLASHLTQHVLNLISDANGPSSTNMSPSSETPELGTVNGSDLSSPHNIEIDLPEKSTLSPIGLNKPDTLSRSDESGPGDIELMDRRGNRLPISLGSSSALLPETNDALSSIVPLDAGRNYQASDPPILPVNEAVRQSRNPADQPIAHNRMRKAAFYLVGGLVILLLTVVIWGIVAFDTRYKLQRNALPKETVLNPDIDWPLNLDRDDLPGADIDRYEVVDAAITTKLPTTNALPTTTTIPTTTELPTTTALPTIGTAGSTINVVPITNAETTTT